jgi:hypothetical protein
MKYTDFLNVGRVLDDFGEVLVKTYRNRLADSRASGQLENTMSFTVKQGDGFFELVLNLQDYWYYIENGRAPGKWPPYTAIRSWIEVKPVIPVATGIPGSNKIPTPEQLTFLIRRKIGRDGIKAKPFLQESINELIDAFYRALEDAFAEDLNVSIENDLLGLPTVVG